MSKLRKKEVVLDHKKYTGTLAPVKNWRDGFTDDPPEVGMVRMDGTNLVIRTQAGDVWARPGDTLVRDEFGTYSVIRAEELAKWSQTAN